MKCLSLLHYHGHSGCSCGSSRADCIGHMHPGKCFNPCFCGVFWVESVFCWGHPGIGKPGMLNMQGYLFKGRDVYSQFLLRMLGAEVDNSLVNSVLPVWPHGLP